MRVRVANGLQVCHDGKTWRDGQTADVPTDVARQWITFGWASEPPSSKSKAADSK